MTTAGRLAVSRERYEELGRLAVAQRAAAREEAQFAAERGAAEHRETEIDAGMTGTAKQIAWATSIRAEYLSRRDGMMQMTHDPRMSDADGQRAREIMARWDTHTQARQWIDSRAEIERFVRAYDHTPPA